jgi:outer membrane lipoprotein-sorting protein
LPVNGSDAAPGARRASRRRRRWWPAGLLVAVVVAFAAPAPAAARIAVALDPGALQMLQNIETYLNGIRTVEADFLQVASTGDTAAGKLYIKRPGRMRIDYQPPPPILVIADGTFLVYYDKELQQVTHIPLGSTPAGILLDPQISLNDERLTVTNFEAEAGAVRVTIVRSEHPAEGSLTLVFSEAPLQLRKWLVIDGQGIGTSVSLVNAEFGGKLDSDLFVFRDPRIFDRKFPK